MKKNVLFIIAITVSNSTFTMEYIKKKLFGFTVNKPQEEMQNLNQQMQELLKIKECLISTINPIIETYLKNTEKLNALNEQAFLDGARIADHSVSISIQGIKFNLSEQHGIIHFTIKNMLDKATLLGEFTIYRTSDRSSFSNLLYSHLLDYFDAVINKLHDPEEGFVKVLSDSRVAEKNPRTVANLKPQYIIPSTSLKDAIERLNEVVKEIAKQIFVRLEQIENETKAKSSSTQN